jgi:hypothetical protein
MTSSTLITTYLSEGTHADRPTTPALPAGGIAIYYETDTTSSFVYDQSSSSWVALGGGGGGGGNSWPWVVTPPTTGLFTTQSYASGATASIATSGHCYTLTATDVGSGGNLFRFTGKAVPTGAWSAVATFLPPGYGRNEYVRVGLALYNLGSTAALHLAMDSASGSPQFALSYWNNNTTYGTTVASQDCTWWGEPVMFKINFDGSSTYTFYYSLDAATTWIQLATASTTSYFTADHIGIGLASYSILTAGAAQAKCVFYSD